MKYRFLFVMLSVLCLSATCRKVNDANKTPDCILKMIETIKSENTWNPPASIWQYEYNGQTVYYVPAHCCDIQSQLFDRNCNLICSPDGGFTGRGDGKCKDFFEKRTKEKLIWRDDRK